MSSLIGQKKEIELLISHVNRLIEDLDNPKLFGRAYFIKEVLNDILERHIRLSEMQRKKALKYLVKK